MAATSERPRVVVAIVTFNSASWIEATLRSVLVQRVDFPFEVLVVDHESHDGTADLVARAFPMVRVLRRPNRGFGAGVNWAARNSDAEILVALNPDAVARGDWLRTLVQGVGPRTVATSMVLMRDDPSSVQTFGQIVHASGLGFLRRGPATRDAAVVDVPGFSGAAFALRREDFLNAGLFDEGIFLYLEDTELSIRLRRTGFRIVGVRDSIVEHRHAPRLSAAKVGFIETSRRSLLHSHLGLREWLCLLPALIGLEAAAWLQASRFGAAGIRAKASAVRARPSPLRVRGQVRFADVVDWKIPPEELARSAMSRFAVGLLSALFRVCLRAARGGRANGLA